MPLRINVPPLTRFLLILLLLTSAVYQFRCYKYRGHQIEADAWFVLTAQRAIYYPWVFITATFAERNVLTLLIAGATILGGGRYLERAWGSAEFGKFLAVVVLGPNVAALLTYTTVFAFTRSLSGAWTTIYGSVALQAAFLVAFKQLVPEHTVTILRGIIKVRVKHFPAVFLVANTISGIVLGTDKALVLSWLGFFMAWTYLRFYKRQPDMTGTGTRATGTRGDASETFAFACFWPDVVQPPIAALSDGIYNALIALRICTPFSVEEVESSNGQAAARGEAGLPSLLNQSGRRAARGGKREEAERRRALALKALDQRLHAATANRQQQTQQQDSAPPADLNISTSSVPSNGDRELDLQHEGGEV